MVKIYIDKNIYDKKLDELFEFIIKKSDSISVSRDYSGFMDLDQFTQMQEEYKKHIIDEDRNRRVKYRDNTDGYQDSIKALNFNNSDKDAEKYFDSLVKQDLSLLDEVEYDYYRNMPDIRFQSASNEYIKTEYTRFTPVTQNPVFEMNYLKLGVISNLIMSGMRGLFDFPYNIQNTKYMDLTFYNNGNVILAICSHEEYAYLELIDDEYENFKKIGING